MRKKIFIAFFNSVLLLGLFFWFSYFLNKVKQTEGNPYDSIYTENSSLKIKSDSLIHANDLLNKKLDVYQVRLDSVYAEIEVKNKKNSILKKSQHEKVTAIDTLSSSELIELFSGLKTR